MTELNHWLLLALLELPEFKLETYTAQSDTWTELRFYLNGKTYIVTIDDVSSLIRSDDDRPLIDIHNPQPIRNDR